jgi:hypothetical protein
MVFYSSECRDIKGLLMRIEELSGYRDNEYMQGAKDIFKQRPADNPATGDDDIIGKLDPNKSSLEYAPYYQMMQFNKFLTAKGFRQLGSGAYAGVWEHPNHPWVFKVFKNDEAYMTYYKWCRSHQNNPNVPKIKGGVIKINDETYAIRMEKLSPIDKDVYNDVDRAVGAFEWYVRGIKKGWDEETMERVRAELEEYREAYPGIYEIMAMIFKSGYRLDLHFNNIMQRGDIPVITDPIVGSGWGTKVEI